MVLTLFSEVGCTGTSKAIKDSEVNLTKVGVKFAVKSAQVDGNPWILFSEERYQGFLAYIEEGRYDDLASIGLPADFKILSVKHKKESLAYPQINLFNSSLFKDDTQQTWWSDTDVKIKCVDSGVGGVWAIKIDQTVVYKDGTGHGATGKGNGWTSIMGKMRQLSVGSQTLWAINAADEVFVRAGLTKDDPKGKEWNKIDGSMKTVSCGPTGVCWAVDKKDVVWRRLGAKESNPIGTKWQSVTGRLQHVSVGQAGIWGISPKNEVMFRDGTYDLPGEAEGSGGWTKVDGMMVWLSSGVNIVWGVSANGELWYRAGIEQSNPMGTNWFKMQTKTFGDKSVEWKMIAGDTSAGCLWGIEAGDVITVKLGAAKEDIAGGNTVSMMEELGNFKTFSLQEKPSSYSVLNGGWVIYEKPNFKGKCLYNHDGDCFSNDPENKKGPKLKTWQDPIGSIRPIKGLDFKAISVTVAMDWGNITTEHLPTTIQSQEARNTTFAYVAADWERLSQVEGMVSHRLELSTPVSGLAGVTFSLEGVPKGGFAFTKFGNKLDTGLDFRQELSNMFTFTTDQEAVRERKKKEVVRLPPNVGPKTDVKIAVVIHKGIIKIPFNAHFVSGNTEWDVAGTYQGEDATQIKLELAETSLLEGSRKVSRL